MKIHGMVSNGIIAVAIASALFFGMKAASEKRAKAPEPETTAVEEPATLEPVPAAEAPSVKPKSEAAFKTSQEGIERLRALKEEKSQIAKEEAALQELARRRPSHFPQPRLRPQEPPSAEPVMTEEERKDREELAGRITEHLERNGGKYNPDDPITLPKSWPEGRLLTLPGGPGGRTITVSNGLTIEVLPHPATVRAYDPTKFRGGLPHSLVKRPSFDSPSNSFSDSPSTPSSP